VRLFVAAELPAPAVEALVAWRPSRDGLRPVARESLHVTLAFLGSRAEEVVPLVGGVLERVARPVGGLSLVGARWLPPRRPRVLAVELGDALDALQADLVAGLAEAIGFVPERRRFLAHVTVARVRDARSLPEPAELPDIGAFAATALTLFRSHLSPKGARYEGVASVSL
jgi:RNA 2',3'-cyclic 3'-phosphodiesterase